MTIWKINILLVSMVFLVAGCNNTEGSSGIVSPTPETASVTIAPIQTGTFTQTSTLTPVPISPTATQTPTILPAVQTLPANEAYRYLIELLHSEACQLPCWLNVIPGQTSPQDTYRVWAPLFGIADHSNILSLQDGYIDFIYKESDVSVFVQTRYTLSDNSNVVESMFVYTQALHMAGNSGSEKIYGTTPYNNILQPYLLPNLLSKYGKPDQIIISMEIVVAEPTSPDYFHVWFLYPQNGAIILYRGPAEIIGGKIIRGCLSNSFVSLWLVPAGNIEIYQKILEENSGIRDLEPTQPYFKSILDAIGMTPDEFFEIYKTPTNRCIESPLEIWPLG